MLHLLRGFQRLDCKEYIHRLQGKLQIHCRMGDARLESRKHVRLNSTAYPVSCLSDYLQRFCFDVAASTTAKWPCASLRVRLWWSVGTMMVLGSTTGSLGSLQKYDVDIQCLVSHRQQKLSGMTALIPSMAEALSPSCIDIWHGQSQRGCELVHRLPPRARLVQLQLLGTSIYYKYLRIKPIALLCTGFM